MKVDNSDLNGSNGSNNSKIRLLKLWDILSRGSDEENPLATGEILKRLYDAGVPCDRKTLYRDIALLNKTATRSFASTPSTATHISWRTEPSTCPSFAY